MVEHVEHTLSCHIIRYAKLNSRQSATTALHHHEGHNVLISIYGHFRHSLLYFVVI